jgi:hypothetical protein
MSVPIPDIGKRPRDDETEALIREALQEEELLKKQKKGEHAVAGDCMLLLLSECPWHQSGLLAMYLQPSCV